MFEFPWLVISARTHVGDRLHVDDRPYINAIVLADWIEIAALLGGGIVTLEEVAELLYAEPIDFSVNTDTGASRDEQYGDAENAFIELRNRSQWLEDSYPITVESDTVSVNQNSPCYRLYSFMVGLRARQIYRGRAVEDPQEPSAIFEEVVTEAARKYVCGASDNRARFGVANHINRRISRGDSLPRKFPAAVSSLSQRLHENIPLEIQGSGDLGVDAIGWHAFGDRRAGQLVFLVQATIGEGDWKVKPVPSAWRRGDYIAFVAEPLTGSAFIESLSLYDDSDLRGLECGIPLDRLRIISLIDDNALTVEWVQRMENWTQWITERLPR